MVHPVDELLKLFDCKIFNPNKLNYVYTSKQLKSCLKYTTKSKLQILNQIDLDEPVNFLSKPVDDWNKIKNINSEELLCNLLLIYPTLDHDCQVPITSRVIARKCVSQAILPHLSKNQKNILKLINIEDIPEEKIDIPDYYNDVSSIIMKFQNYYLSKPKESKSKNRRTLPIMMKKSRMKNISEKFNLYFNEYKGLYIKNNSNGFLKFCV